MKPASHGGRRGVSLLAALLALSVVSAVLLTVGWRIVAHRRHETQRQYGVQANWLARAGVELAVDKLLSSPDDYKGETVELLPKSQVRIQVESDPKVANTYRVVSEARYPSEGPNPAVRTVTRSVRRKVEKGEARVEVVP